MKYKPAKSIIVIDRDEITIALLELQFRKAGFTGELVMFTEIAEAAVYFENNRLPDILISDFVVNKIDQFELLLKLQQIAVSSQHSMKIIITGEFMSDREGIPAELSNWDFVAKPVDVGLVGKWWKGC